jgi:hypothetical protein
MRNFIIDTVRMIMSRRARWMHGGNEKCIQILVRKTEETTMETKAHM